MTESGLTLGLLTVAFAFGLRHGIDWDHIAAITDITASQATPRRGALFATLYALGHAAVVLVLGVVAILLGERLPPSVDRLMGRVVGITLVMLGVYVLYALVRYRQDFRMRSRWMLVLEAVRRAGVWLAGRLRRGDDVEHEHEHLAGDEAFAHHDEHSSDHSTSEGGHPLAALTHRHRHRHRPADPFVNYGPLSSLAVGALHGIGAETPTQVLIFLTAAGAGGLAGVAVLVAFLLGLLASNSLITLGSASGFLAAGRRFPIYAGLSVVTGVVSLVVGTLFVLGKETFLPAVLGG
jgi:cytochrome c biogenesis protein CcdA